MSLSFAAGLIVVVVGFASAVSDEIKHVVVRPHESNQVLLNPGIGFTTFQRFNGDELNSGLNWTEGFPINAKPARRGTEYKAHPNTSVAYFRIYWRYIEPNEGEYRWELIDRALAEAKAHHQTLMLRVAPYGPSEEGQKSDVPDWYRARASDKSGIKFKNAYWRIDHERAGYLKYFGGLVSKLAARYDGHADLELVDISIVGPWGEGAGTELLSKQTRDDLLLTYAESFKTTPLAVQPADWGGSGPAESKKYHVGFRADCLGDTNLLSPTWSHMFDLYPQYIITSGLAHAWEERPVAFEACYVMGFWKKAKVDLDYVIEQSLKWHISTFNAKSSAVPPEWRSKVEGWLKRMGYRFVLRRFEYPAIIARGEPIVFSSWWENKGVAPPYRNFPVALRLVSATRKHVVLTDVDVRQWLPGDHLLNSSLTLPADIAAGNYSLQLALVDEVTHVPKIRLAIDGQSDDGWYSLGSLQLK